MNVISVGKELSVMILYAKTKEPSIQRTHLVNAKKNILVIFVNYIAIKGNLLETYNVYALMDSMASHVINLVQKHRNWIKKTNFVTVKILLDRELNVINV